MIVKEVLIRVSKMKTPAISLFVQLSMLSVAFSADLLVEGELRVTGGVDIEGNVATIGSWVGDPTNPGLTIQYVENSGVSILSMDASRSSHAWLWRRESGAGMVNSMELGATHTLTLLQSNGTTAGVILDPSGSSTFQGAIVAYGAENKLPNQTLATADSIVTRSLGDSRYLRSGATTLVYGTGSSATSPNSVALGSNAVATGTLASPSVAIGTDVVAVTSDDGQGSVAIGWGAKAGTPARGGAVSIGQETLAYGLGSIAMGFQSHTESYGTIAIGTAAQALEGYAISIGFWAYAEGYQSKSLGNYTVATGFSQTVMGQYNIIDTQADKFSRQANDKLFVIGNGSAWNDRSNALEIKWSGDATLHGSLTVKKELKVEDKASFEGPVRVPPGGGLSMGEFTHDPEAQP